MTMPRDIEFLDTSADLVLRFLETDDEFEVRAGHLTKGIKLEKEYLDNILYKNHEDRVGIKPREINKVALRRYIQKYLKYLPDTKNRQFIQDYYRRNLL